MTINSTDFDLAITKKAALITTQKGIFRITSPEIIKALEWIKNQTAETNIEEIDLSEKYNLTKNDWEDFLIATFPHSIRKPSYFSGATFITEEKSSLFYCKEIITSETRCKITYLTAAQDTSQQKCEKRYFVISALNYNYSDLKKKFFSLASSNPDSAISVIYSNGESIYISAPFIPSIGNPCHFCLIDKIIAFEKNSPRGGWSKLLNHFIKQHEPIPLRRFTAYQRALTSGAIAKKINLHTQGSLTFRTQDCNLPNLAINLHSGESSEETIPHWTMCDCLRTP
ncbi:McbB family protein [Metapseudomonas furukawaii]|uniref:McbB family protein n=1 Tax=Metapseudomonas furukawaii TaxID=1149133 RepID=UPI0013143095|nr:McbB family protein [Pseudomonas furukawaii]